MEKLSDFLGHKPQPERNGAQNKSADFISPRRLQPNESLIEKLRGSPANQTADYERGIDRLVQGLMDLLPKPDSIWSIEDRVKWLRLAEGIFDIGYKIGDGEQGEISIVAVRQVPGAPTNPGG
jgi:hypothetical protein